jgi:hypothetical protein
LKLRLHKQSIRVRLTQGEVDRLGQGESLDYTLQLGQNEGDGWRFLLTPSADIQEYRATYAGASLQVQIPLAQAQALAQTDLVTVEASLALGPNPPLKLFLEKDFQCLKPRTGDDDHDTFQHPSAGVIKC